MHQDFKLILGSASRGRREVLTRIGYEFDVMSADIDEKAIRFDDPCELTMALAHAKARALLPRIKEKAILITSDQVVVCDGVIREKPETRAQAIEFLKSYADYPAETVTAVVVNNIGTGQVEGNVDRAKVFFHTIPDDVILAIIDQGEVFLNAGGFSIDNEMLAPYVAEIVGERDSIIGLPKALTMELLKRVV